MVTVLLLPGMSPRAWNSWVVLYVAPPFGVALKSGYDVLGVAHPVGHLRGPRGGEVDIQAGRAGPVGVLLGVDVVLVVRFGVAVVHEVALCSALV